MQSRISLSGNERKKYRNLIVIIVFVFVLLFSSRLFFQPRVNGETTKIGETVRLDTRDFQLVTHNYYPEQHTLAFSFFSPVSSLNVLDELTVRAKQSSTDDTEYHSKIKKITDDYYVVVLTDLPEKWEKFDITIFPKGKDTSMISSDQSFHFMRADVTSDQSFNEKRSSKSYEIEAINFQLEALEKEQKSNRKEIEKREQDIEKIKQVNEELTASQENKVDSEKETLTQTITENENKVTSLQTEILELKESSKELQSKQEKLEDRKQQLS